jgi:hypothetical protein
MISQDLVRQNAYQVLDATIEVALDQRSSDFTGVITCTPSDTLASILAYIRERRCHRFVIVEEEDVPAEEGEGGRPSRKKGSLVGILSLSDVLRWMVGHENLKGHEVPGLGKSSCLPTVEMGLTENVGVHGLRGVGTPLTGGLTIPAPNTDVEPELLSAGTSRRGSEGSSTRMVSSESVAAMGLEEVVEGEALATV